MLLDPVSLRRVRLDAHWLIVVAGIAHGSPMPTGARDHHHLAVDEATQPSKVQWTCIAHTGHPEWVGTQPTFEIVSNGGHDTALNLHHVGLAPALSCYQQCERGWDHFLASIVAYVESGRGTPFGS